MQLFYQDTLQEDSTSFTFEKNESRHIVRVLRKREGDLIHITNGRLGFFVAEIVIADEKKCKVKIVEVIHKSPNRNYRLQIAIAPTKSTDRFEWFLEKATEIGVDDIFPIICKHSERKVIKEQRLQKVLVTAMKQSLQYQLPVLHKAMSFDAFLKRPNDAEKYIAYCENQTQKSTRNQLNKLLKPAGTYCILIGPEGDFSADEIALAFQNKFIPISLGATRLRTETAGIVAAHTVRLLNDFYE